MKKVGVLTLGCKVNLYESEYICDVLENAGYIIGNFTDICDVYIINTCTVTNTSDVKSRKMIRKAIRNNPNACVVVMGCFIEANKDYQEDGVDIIIGNKDKSKIVELLAEYFTKKEIITRLYKNIDTNFEDMFITNFKDRTRAFVKIQDGCENFCSYCIIPYVRGKRRSKDFNKVIEEITTLVNNNYQEIVLTGIHTGSYGVDIESSFSELLSSIVKIKGLKRLRISSIEITELNDEVLTIIKNNKVIVDHLHIPLQAGSNKILKLMRRKYDLAYYEAKIKEIRNIRGDIAITTDIIVGHPGEGDIDFQNTMDFSKKIEFAKIHVFPYSPRKNTLAASMENQVADATKKIRAKTLIKLSKELEIKYFTKFLNKEVDVLIEEVKDGCSYGHTSNFIHVKINKILPSNTFIKVVLKEVTYPYVEGVV